MTPAEELVLVHQAQAGSADAFKQLYDLAKPKILATVLRWMNFQYEDAEELTADSFLQAFRKLSSFRGSSRFSTWVHKIALNNVRMNLRRKKLLTISLDQLPVDRDGKPMESPYLTSIDVYQQNVDLKHVLPAIQQLSPGYQRVLMLHEVHGFQHREIAKLTGRTAGNSKSQLHKAKEAARKVLV